MFRTLFTLQRLTVVGFSLLGLALVFLFAGLTQYNDVIELLSVYFRYNVRGELDSDPRIRIVYIDDTTIGELEDLGIPYPFPRALQGELLRRLAERGAKVVCFDILFDTKSHYGEEDDYSFRDSIKYARSLGTEVILASAISEISVFGGMIETILTPNETLMEAEPELGMANTSVKLGESGRGSFREKERSLIEREGKTYYSQATMMYSFYLSELGQEFEPADHGIDENGYMTVNYFNGKTKRFKMAQYVELFPEVLEGINPITGEEVLEDDVEWETGETAARLGLAGDDPEWEDEETEKDAAGGDTGVQDGKGDYEGAYVLVGSFSEADSDYFSTPFNRKMFGVETNANALLTLVTGKHIREVPFFVTLLILLIGSLVAGHIAYFLPSKIGPLWALVAALAVFGLFSLLIVLGFVFWHLLFNFTFTALGFALSFGGTLSYRVVTEEREKARIRKTFGRYVSEAVLEEIINKPELAELGGVDKKVAVLFCDIRSFSTISEDMSPRDVLGFLNLFFESTSNIIEQYGGHVDKFMGDGIMAVFGAPHSIENPPLSATRCALEIIKNLKENVYPRLEEIGAEKFNIGIGIHFGHVIMGNIGSKRRTDYSIIGDAVNLAARLETQTKVFKRALIVSTRVYDSVKEEFPCHFLATVKVRGRAADESIYWVEHPEIPGLTDL